MWSSSVLVCGLTIELLQIFGIVNGTFDLFDILSLFLGYLLALLILIFYL